MPAREWLDLEYIARVEVTSEDPAFPVEAALKLSESGGGWRASQPGEQKLTILFDAPTLVHLIHLEFAETSMSRTQEISLHWSGSDAGRHQIVRQQWNFSPTGSTVEAEDFRVDLAGVLQLELSIKPDISGNPSAIASLSQMRLA